MRGSPVFCLLIEKTEVNHQLRDLKMQTHITTEFAILAPVPIMHLESARKEGLTEAAFGVSANVKKRLDNADSLRGDAVVRVLIYASLEDEKPEYPCATWAGYYTGAETTDEQRPATTENSQGEDKEGWTSFWLVSCLTELSEPVTIGKLGGRGKNTYYDKTFKPRSLMLIRYPADIEQFAMPG